MATRFVIVGGGPAGNTAATYAARLGAEVTMIERDIVGGAAHLWDCIPSKTMIATGGAMAFLKRSSGMGLEPAKAEVDTEALAGRIEGIKQHLQEGVTRLLSSQGVRMVRGSARFLDAHEVEVTGVDGTERIAFDNALIATGSRPRIPEWCSPDGDRILTTRDCYPPKVFPESVTVIGSGVTGVEFVHMPSRSSRWRASSGPRSRGRASSWARATRAGRRRSTSSTGRCRPTRAASSRSCRRCRAAGWTSCPSTTSPTRSCHMLDRREAGVLNLVAGRNASTVDELTALASEYFGKPVPPFVDPVDPDDPDNHDSVYVPYFDMRVVFDDARARSVLVPAGIEAPPLRDYFPKLMDYAKAARWGKAQDHARGGARAGVAELATT